MSKEKVIRHNFIWIDLEMTGLDPQRDLIIEIATIITNDELEIIARGPDLVIHYPDNMLPEMDPWVVKCHGKSGLMQRVSESTITLEQAQEQTLDFIKQYFKEKEGILCGNSVWNDKQFLRVHMPKLHDYMYYRIVDVSSLKELIKRWYPASPYTDFKKRECHRAMIDIEESIEELRHYRNHFFLPIELTQRPEENKE